MEIRTIAQTDPTVFDDEVNTSLMLGWRLTKRHLVQTPAGTKDYFYAELVKLDPPAEPEKPDLLKAVQVIKAECDSHGSCEDCLVYPWCDYNAPCRWKLPEEVQDDGE